MVSNYIYLLIILFLAFVTAVFFWLQHKHPKDNFGVAHQVKEEEQNQNNGGIILHFKDGIKIYRLETYRDITIAYLNKPKDPLPEKPYYTYHFFWNGVIEFDEATDLEELRTLAVNKIDELYAGE